MHGPLPSSTIIGGLPVRWAPFAPLGAGRDGKDGVTGMLEPDALVLCEMCEETESRRDGMVGLDGLEVVVAVVPLRMLLEGCKAAGRARAVGLGGVGRGGRRDSERVDSLSKGEGGRGKGPVGGGSIDARARGEARSDAMPGERGMGGDGGGVACSRVRADVAGERGADCCTAKREREGEPGVPRELSPEARLCAPAGVAVRCEDADVDTGVRGAARVPADTDTGGGVDVDVRSHCVTFSVLAVSVVGVRLWRDNGCVCVRPSASSSEVRERGREREPRGDEGGEGRGPRGWRGGVFLGGGGGASASKAGESGSGMEAYA